MFLWLLCWSNREYFVTIYHPSCYDSEETASTLIPTSLRLHLILNPISQTLFHQHEVAGFRGMGISQRSTAMPLRGFAQATAQCIWARHELTRQHDSMTAWCPPPADTFPAGIQSSTSRRNSSRWDEIIQPQTKCVLYEYSKIKNTTPNNLLKLSNTD